MTPRAPVEIVRRLRRLLEEPTLEVLFDEEQAFEKQAPVWFVAYRPGGKGARRQRILTWPHPLEGATESIAGLVAEVDFRRRRHWDYYLGIDREIARRKKAKERRLDDRIADHTDYAYEALKARLVDDKPTVTANWKGGLEP